MAGGNSMQAIIMAAGKGNRLKNLTGGKPKSFLEIKGKKLIEYNLRLLQKYQINDIIIVTGYQSESFEAFTANMNNIRLIYNPFYEMVNVLGSFYMGMTELHEDFIYLHADTLCEPIIFEKLVHPEADIVLPIDYKKCDNEAMKVRSHNGKIVQITKQMPLDQAEGEFIGMAAFKKEVLPSLKEKTIQLMKEKAFTDYFESAIQRLIDEENFLIKSIPVNGIFWSEIDFIQDYENTVMHIPKRLTDIFE